MGEELGSATDIDGLLASSGLLCVPLFALIGNDDFWSCQTYFVGQKCRQKSVISSFLGYLGEFDSDSQTVWTCTCTIAPRSVLPIFKSNLQWLTRFDFTLYPLLGWPSSY